MKKQKEWKPDIEKYDKIIKASMSLLALTLAREILCDYAKFKKKSGKNVGK